MPYINAGCRAGRTRLSCIQVKAIDSGEDDSTTERWEDNITELATDEVPIAG